MALRSLLIAGTLLVSSTSATIDELVGTWSTKSAKVLTGPGFYNPINDSLIEPSHTGISYSFTADGFYEEAYYRAVSNPTKPSCPQAVMQWQHGTFTVNTDNSLTLTPFSVDGRQLQSDPCNSKTASYTRYNQTETLAKYQVYTDGYTKMTRLDLYEFDGTPMNPMFMAYNPPMMLPTVTLNPTTSATATAAKSKRTAGAGEPAPEPLNKDAMHIKRREELPLLHRIDLNMLWWGGVGMIVFGGTAYLL